MTTIAYKSSDEVIRKRLEVSILVGGIGFLFLLQAWFRPLAIEGLYFQQYSSELMMQTVSLESLRFEPFSTLFYLHIQPPLLDTIRALLAQLFPNAPYAALVKNVDQALYLVWSVVYGLMGLLIFRVLRNADINPAFSAIGAILFLLHPASILYATFLEGTLLSAFGVLWLYYELTRPDGPQWVRVTVCFIFLFFARSIFQWPAILVLVATLYLLKMPSKHIARFTLVASFLVIGYLAKQYFVFGITTTSSFVGSSCLHSLGIFPDMDLAYPADGKLPGIIPTTFTEDLPASLTEPRKPNEAVNFNYAGHLRNEREFLKDCKNVLESQPWQTTVISYIHNLLVFLQPSNQYVTPHVIADRLPWKASYEFIMSGIPLILILTLSGCFWLVTHTKENLPKAVGLVLPVLFIFLVCILYEKPENMRYKYFIEPVLFAFIFSQGYHVMRFKGWKNILDERLPISRKK